MRIFLTIQACFIKAHQTCLLLILLIQYLDSILNLPAGKDYWNVSLFWDYFVCLFFNIHNQT